MERRQWAAWPIAPAGAARNPVAMRHPELLAPIATLLAIEVAHLRWIVLTQFQCRQCHASHLECECKPAWVKILL